MRWFIFAVLGLIFVGATSAAAQTGVRIENAAARVVLVPEPRRDVLVFVSPGRAGVEILRSRNEGDDVVLDGGLSARRGPFGVFEGSSCQGSGDHVHVLVPGRGLVALADLPVITIRSPLAVRLAVGPAVYGEIGPARSVDFVNSGCGDWRLGDVQGPLHLVLTGAGDLHGRGAGEVQVKIAGSSEVQLGALLGLQAQIAGSGDVHAATVNGPITVRIGGSGDVLVDGGRSPSVICVVAGSGDLRFRGVAAMLQATVVGSGDVDVAHVTGSVIKHVAGSGDVNVGR